MKIEDLLLLIQTNHYDLHNLYKPEVEAILQDNNTVITSKSFETVLYIKYFNNSPILDDSFMEGNEDYRRDHIDLNVFFHINKACDYPDDNKPFITSSIDIPHLIFQKHFIIYSVIQDNPELIHNPRFKSILETKSRMLTSTSLFYQDYLML